MKYVVNIKWIIVDKEFNMTNSTQYEKLREVIREKFEHWGSGIQKDDVEDFVFNDFKETVEKSEHFKLYRYMPVSYYNIRNLETQIIHLSSNGELNDIYEGVTAQGLIQNNYQLQKFGGAAYMTCMTETYDNILMWSHYANSHKGICIEYDVKKLLTQKNAFNYYIYPVIYGKVRLKDYGYDINKLIYDMEELENCIKNNAEYDGNYNLDDLLPLFLIKNECWSYEKEWRVIYTRKQIYDIDKEALYSFNIPFPCISGVYLGYRIDKTVEEDIIEIKDRFKSKNINISVYKAKLSNDSFDIRFDKID